MDDQNDLFEKKNHSLIAQQSLHSVRSPLAHLLQCYIPIKNSWNFSCSFKVLFAVLVIVSSGFFGTGITSASAAVVGPEESHVGPISKSNYFVGTPIAIQSKLSSPSQLDLQNNSSAHTLVLRGLDKQATYSITVSGSVSTEQTESTDASRQSTVSGVVGSTDNTNDSTDIIHFTGYIAQFTVDGSVRAGLDGWNVDPGVLDGRHIRLTTRGTNTSPGDQINYSFSVSGMTVPSKDAEPNDIPDGPNTSTVTGSVEYNDSDDFYYTGEITKSNVSGNLKVVIDGQEVPVTDSNEPSTSTPSPSNDSQTSSTPTFSDLPYQVSNLTVDQSTVAVEEQVTVTVRVTNTEDKRVEAPLQLATSGTVVNTKQVALFPGEWREVSFTHTYESPGNYTIRVGDSEIPISVQENLDEGQQNSGSNGLIIGIIVFCSIGIVVVLLWGRIKQ